MEQKSLEQGIYGLDGRDNNSQGHCQDGGQPYSDLKHDYGHKIGSNRRFVHPTNTIFKCSSSLLSTALAQLAHALVASIRLLITDDDKQDANQDI